MARRVLIIGGYGHFGGHIARSLAGDPALRLLIGGRSERKGRAFVETLTTEGTAEAHAIDIAGDLQAALARIGPDIVIHTSGPFQGRDYAVAQACIERGCHYIDLADARGFVARIGALDAAALAKDVLVVSGASSVPCLTAAVIDDHLPRYARLERVDYGISTAQHTRRGLATTASVLGYVGKPFRALRGGRMRRVFGWQDLHAEQYPHLGTRLFGNCDIPDLALFPGRYRSLATMRFGAGHELAVLQIGTWLLGWLVRLGAIGSLADHTDTLMRLAGWFDRFGSGDSGFHMILDGVGHDGAARRDRFYLIARSGHGPLIPCIPAILIARRLARGELTRRGAIPCLDLITLADYLDALSGLDIAVVRDGGGT